MTSTKPSEKTAESSNDDSAAPAKRDGTRETIESIVIAFIFAFLFRTFEAEAFVIPTGSMAPTLMGRHKDEACPSCGFEFTVGASEEIDQETGLLNGPRWRLKTAVCPNCRYTLDIKQDPVFVGDRILVTKFNYKISDPDRWDVTVFKYPEDPSTNYIKRLCGLPGETIEIRQGDLYRIDDGQAEVLRKHDAAKQAAVLQTVYDDDHPPRELIEAGWPERWAAVAHDNGPEAVAGWSVEVDGWQADPQTRSYRIDPSDEDHWLRYRHFVPTTADWRDAGTGQMDAKARLILDFLAYDTSESDESRFFSRGVYWVGDLSVAATLNVEEIKPDAEIVLELVEGDRKYRCTIDPNEGMARLSYLDAMDRDWAEDAARLLSEAAIDISEPDDYEIRFSNIDDRLWLVIDGEAVEFETPAYKPFMGQLIQLPSANDLTPVGISARGVAMSVSHLKLERDIYYRAEIRDPAPILARLNPGQPVFIQEVGTEVNEHRLHERADDPEAYGELYAEFAPWSDDGKRRRRWLPLFDDEFLLLGDNSPRSSDSRLWSNHRDAEHRHAVQREALVGKALLIFWPHGMRIGNVQNGHAHGWTIPFLDGFFYHRTVEGPPGQEHTVLVEDYPAHGVPFYPNFERILRRIR